MNSLSFRAIVDLMTARRAIRDDQRVGVRPADRGKQRQFAHFSRNIDSTDIVAEAARHPTAARFHGFDRKLRDQAKDAFDLVHGIERLLMTMAVEESRPWQWPQRQF